MSEWGLLSSGSRIWMWTCGPRDDHSQAAGTPAWTYDPSCCNWVPPAWVHTTNKKTVECRHQSLCHALVCRSDLYPHCSVLIRFELRFTKNNELQWSAASTFPFFCSSVRGFSWLPVSWAQLGPALLVWRCSLTSFYLLLQEPLIHWGREKRSEGGKGIIRTTEEQRGASGSRSYEEKHRTECSSEKTQWASKVEEKKDQVPVPVVPQWIVETMCSETFSYQNQT